MSAFFAGGLRNDLEPVVCRLYPAIKDHLDWLRRHEHEVAVSAVVLGEIEFGILLLPSGRKRKALEEWFARVAEMLPVLEMDRETARVWAALLARLRRKGRAMPVKDSLIAASALQHGLAVATPDGRAELARVLADARADVVAVVAYGTLLDAACLAATGAGAVNLHLSLLPRWRGAAPVQAAVRARDAETGVSAFLIDAGMDTGPVVASETVAVGPDETAGELLDRLARLGAPVLVAALRAVVAGERGTPQPDVGVTLAPRLGANDLVLDLTASAEDVAAHVRSLAPLPGASPTLRGTSLKVLAARVVDGTAGGDEQATSATARPGQVVALGKDGPVVACGRGAVRLDLVRPSGRGTMSGRDLVNGGTIAVGDRLGAADATSS
jgi:methionyl-tRNA formyltransferase